MVLPAGPFGCFSLLKLRNKSGCFSGRLRRRPAHDEKRNNCTSLTHSRLKVQITAAKLSPSPVLLPISCAARTHVELPDQPGTVPDQRHRPVQRPALPVRLHLSVAARRALPHVSLRGPVHAGKQPDGHWEHLRAGSPAALQRCRVGQEHPLFPWSAADGPGETATLEHPTLWFDLLVLGIIPFWPRVG